MVKLNDERLSVEHLLTLAITAKDINLHDLRIHHTLFDTLERMVRVYRSLLTDPTFEHSEIEKE